MGCKRRGSAVIFAFAGDDSSNKGKCCDSKYVKGAENSMRSSGLSVGLLSLMLTACGGDEIPDTRMEIALPGEFGEHYSEMLLDPLLIDEAEKATLYRQHNMRALSASYRSLELIVRYGLDQEAHLEEYASALTSAARRVADNFEFPASAVEGRSGARAVIWNDHEGFARHVRGLVRDSETLSRTVENGLVDRQALLGSLEAVRHQCLACHDRYRRRL